ncbi:hypothetical protein GCM10027435_11530 [Haloparvum alkalitolerans]|uniref:DUF7094 domain-containing protein n=1 Tax=Haloparvum alkalitolerans TaxID=1042953 RepID=UPI003CF51B0C
MRALPLLLAALLLAAPVVAGVAPDRPSAAPADAVRVNDGGALQQSDPDDTARVPVLSHPADAAVRADIGRHGSNLGPASGLEVSATTAAMETASVVAHVESAGTNDERIRRLIEAESGLQQDELALHSRQRSAIQAHAAGELTDEELVVELARISAAAEALDRRRVELETLAEETEDFSISTAELQLRLGVYSGPVRELATDALRGEVSSDRIYVASGDNAVVLAAVVDGQYVREVYRGDRWDRGASGFGDGSEEAINATAEAYGEALDDQSASTLESNTIVRVDTPLTDERGRVRTYVSSGDGGVFVEHQYRPLDPFAEAESVAVTQDGYNLTVNRTYPGGPVRVSVVDVEEEAPAAGVTVTVAGDGAESEEVGTTNEEGVLWTLSPSEPYQVTAVEEPRVARISGIEPTAIPRTDGNVSTTDG